MSGGTPSGPSTVQMIGSNQRLIIHGFHLVEDEYVEEPSSCARFDDTDDEEREENIDSLVLQEYDGKDMPTIEWNRENPDLTPGTVFESMVDCRNEVTAYCIVTENSYEVDRSEPERFTVHCPYDR
ncbi:hypothetical protein D1007_16186 [Hordeum vulgare]|nr:hypothetical protein D1007_16186 [Hordeum vulgare]